MILAACLLVCADQLLRGDELSWGTVGLPGKFGLTSGGAHMAVFMVFGLMSVKV